MIGSFKDSITEAVFQGIYQKGFPAALMKTARRKLEMIQAAEQLGDLSRPPANRLEPLKANRAGQHSIRINRQFRICFRWTPKGAEDVEIVDYHDE